MKKYTKSTLQFDLYAKIYDIKGEKLVDVTLNQGRRQLTWDLNVGV
jgi:hypothetical protein